MLCCEYPYDTYRMVDLSIQDDVHVMLRVFLSSIFRYRCRTVDRICMAIMIVCGSAAAPDAMQE